MEAPEGSELHRCMHALNGAGYDVKLHSGAKAFVHPEQYLALLDSIASDEVKLFTSSVLVSEDLEAHVLAALAGLKSEGVRLTGREDISADWEQLSVSMKMTVRRTFLELRVRS